MTLELLTVHMDPLESVIDERFGIFDPLNDVEPNPEELHEAAATLTQKAIFLNISAPNFFRAKICNSRAF